MRSKYIMITQREISAFDRPESHFTTFFGLSLLGTEVENLSGDPSIWTRQIGLIDIKLKPFTTQEISVLDKNSK